MPRLRRGRPSKVKSRKAPPQRREGPPALLGRSPPRRRRPVRRSRPGPAAIPSTAQTTRAKPLQTVSTTLYDLIPRTDDTGNDALLTRLAKEQMGEVSVDVGEQGEVLFVFERLRRPRFHETPAVRVATPDADRDAARAREAADAAEGAAERAARARRREGG